MNMKRSRRKTCLADYDDVKASVHPHESSAGRNTLGKKDSYRSESAGCSPTFQGYFPVIDTIKRAPRHSIDSSSRSRGNSTNSILASSNDFSRSIIEDSLPEENGSYLETKIANYDSSTNESFNQHENMYNGLAKERSSFGNKCSISSQTLLECKEVVNSNLCLKTPSLDESNQNEGFEPKINNEIDISQARCNSLAEISTTDLCKTQYPLQGLVSFVDVRSDHDNRSEGVAKVLKKLGATVERKLTPGITHVVFSNGRQSTLKFVDKHDIFFVSVLWVDSCMQNHVRADESLFPASRCDGMSPNRNKMNRLKSMQPKAFEEEMKDSGKLEERRRKRNVFKGKKSDLPFDLISLEDIEMNDISKKIQEHTSAINSPIATQSPFLDQVMRRLSEKRASLEGSPECTKVDESILQNDVNDKEDIEREKDHNQSDDALCRNSEELFEKEGCELGTEGTRLVPHQLDSKLEVDDNILKDLNLKRESKDIQENSNKIDRHLLHGSNSDEILKKRYKRLDTTAIETEAMVGDCIESLLEPTFSGEENNTRAISKADETKKAKSKKKRLLSKCQVLSSDNAAMLNTSAKTLADVKGGVKLASKRKRIVEKSSRKRRKGVTCEAKEDVQDDIANAFDHFTNSDDNKTGCVTETGRIEPTKIVKKRNRQNQNLKQPTSSKSNVMNKGSLVMTSMHYGQQEFVRNTVKKLGLFSITKTVNSATTHVVAGNGRRTLNILNAIAQGCWIVSPSWVSDSYEQGGWLDEEQFELEDLFPSAKLNRRSKLETGKSLSCSLFEKLDPIFVAENTAPPKFELLKLIRKCGGQVTSNAKIAHVCVGDSTELELDCQLVSEKWILDCVMKTALLDVDDYIIGKGNTSVTY